MQPLACHPSQSCAFVHAVKAQVETPGTGRIEFHYRIDGDIEQLRLPAPRIPARAQGLWRRTCLEAFIAAPGTPAYLEFNFSPSGEWAIYRFDDYRRGMAALEPAQAPRIQCWRTTDRLEVEVEIQTPLPAHDPGARLAISVILQDLRGQLSHWALAHPSPEPDFHHPGGFTLALPASGGVTR
jgi:hypothetical protein